MDFRILGSLEVREGGAALPLGGPKQRAVLAVLLLGANEVVPSERLIDALWAEPPARAAKAIQVYVARLRKLLGRERLETRAGGYLLRAASDELDLARFRQLLPVPRATPEAAAAQLRAALELWRGPALAEFADEPFARAAGLRLEELRLEALEARIEADLALGRHTALVGELEALVAEHPLREGPRGQLMLALYRCGRQAEALDVYREGRRLLVQELGVEPGRSLRDLEQAILRQDASLDAPAQPRPEAASDGEAALEVQPPPERSREERKVVSVLFADLADFVALGDGVDPEDLRTVLAPYHNLLRAELERFGGTVEKFIGDAVMAVFGAPLAHEDDAERAVRAGLALLAAIERRNEERAGPELVVRVAVDTGEAVVALGARAAEGEGIVTGDVVNVASRLQQLAPTGSLVVGEATYQATRSTVAYEELEPANVRGKAGALRLWRATGVRAAPARATDLPLVGREPELALLEQLYRRAVREATAQLVTVTGEPGVGKSRLVAELQAHVAGPWLRGRCLPYGDGVTFWALGDIVKAEAGIVDGDGPGEAAEKLSAAVAASIEEPSERQWVEARLAPLVGADLAESRTGDRSESFTAWRRFLESIAARAPLVLLFEDLHWADDALLDFVEHLVDRSSTAPLLVVCTARPDLYERRPVWGGGKRNSTTISLAPLSAEKTARLVASLLGDAALPSGVESTLLDRAAGNPLYAIEFVRMLTDRGLGESRPATGAGVPVPETVQALIAGRLDTLSPERKSLLQDAAVIGNVFSAEALAFVSGRAGAEVAETLHELERREFVRRLRASAVPGGSEFSFWHLLVRDVTYRQIPRATRAEKHRAVATWLERLAGERLADQAELLAHHYSQALQLGRAAGLPTAPLADGARRALAAAGDRAAALCAYEAAARFYAEAVELCKDCSERPRLLLRGGRARWFGLGSGLELVADARALFETADDPEGAAEAGTFLGFALWMSGDGDEAYRQVDRAIALVAQRQDTPAKAYAVGVRGRMSAFAGEEQAIDLGRRGLDLAGRLALDELRAQSLATLGLARLTAGEAGGLGDLEQSLELALAINAPLEISRGHNNVASVHRQLGELERAEEDAAAARAVCERFGLPAQLHFVASNEVALAYLRGRWSDAERIAEEFIARTEAGAPHYHVVWRWVRAKIRLGRDDTAGALEDAARELELARRSPYRQHLGSALTLGARVLLAAGRGEEAARLADEYLALPIRQQAAFAPGPGIAVLDLAWALADLGRGAELGRLAGAAGTNAWLEPALAVAHGEPARAADLLAGIGEASEQAYARLRAAAALLAEDAVEAESQLRRALAFHRSVGAVRYVREADAIERGVRPLPTSG